MKRDKIVKMVMSAAVMASVVAVPTAAEGSGEDMGADLGGLTDIGEEAVSVEAGQQILQAVGQTLEKAVREQALEEGYWVQRSISEGPGAARWQNRNTQEAEEYGSHCVELVGEPIPEEEESQEAMPSYTEEDLYILAHAICGEGQCYPDEDRAQQAWPGDTKTPCVNV